MDVWLSLDPLTGEKQEIVSFSEKSTCPVSPDEPSKTAKPDKSKVLLIGKSEYTISMVDGSRKWNVTFNDYSSIDMNADLVKDYGKLSILILVVIYG
jgi:hypothetical protein